MNKTRIEIVVAMDDRRGIGCTGRIPWRLCEDLKRFKTITTGGGRNTVIMGRSTWESLPHSSRPLPQRENIILSRDPDKYSKYGSGTWVSSYGAAVAASTGRVFVIGGSAVYATALQCPGYKILHVTRVHGTWDCDRHMPRFESEATLLDSTPGEGCTYQTWELG